MEELEDVDMEAPPVELTLTHPLVARAEHPEAEALLAECCPHGAVPGLVRGGVVALFLPAPRSTLRVFVALVGRGAGQRLAPLRGPLHSTFSGRGTRSEVAHVVEGCDTVATTRRVLHATRFLHRVQPRGDVPDLQFLGQSASFSLFAAAPDPARGFDCCKDLDLSGLSAPSLTLHKPAVHPLVIRFPQGHPSQRICAGRGQAFIATPIRRVVFHPETLFSSIGANAFCYAENLTAIDFRGLKNMPSFGTRILEGCSNLAAVCMRGLPSLESVGACAFLDCGKLSFVDCRDCPLLRTECYKAFDGNAADLRVLTDGAAQSKAIQRSMAKEDRRRATVLTADELEQRRSETGNVALHRCPVCECHDDEFEATFYDYSPSSH